MSFIVKNTTFLSLLDLIAPHSCRGCERLGEVLCECCKKHIVSTQNNICPNCKKILRNYKCEKCAKNIPIFYIGERKDLLADLIHDFKYNSVRAIGVEFAKILDETLPKNLPENSIIVPLPTSTKHIRERGFDHTLFIAKRLAKLRHLKTEKTLLRVKNTVQVGTDRKTRLAQADSAYIVNPKIKVNPKTTYILFDDVWTTGASIKASLKKLRKAGAKKFVVVLLAINRLD